MMFFDDNHSDNKCNYIGPIQKDSSQSQHQVITQLPVPRILNGYILQNVHNKLGAVDKQQATEHGLDKFCDFRSIGSNRKDPEIVHPGISALCVK